MSFGVIYWLSVWLWEFLVFLLIFLVLVVLWRNILQIFQFMVFIFLIGGFVVWMIFVCSLFFFFIVFVSRVGGSVLFSGIVWSVFLIFWIGNIQVGIICLCVIWCCLRFFQSILFMSLMRWMWFRGIVIYGQFWCYCCFCCYDILVCIRVRMRRIFGMGCWRKMVSVMMRMRRLLRIGVIFVYQSGCVECFVFFLLVVVSVILWIWLFLVYLVF